MKKTSLIIIGNEILDGKITDINTGYLGQKLHEMGESLSQVIISADSKEEIIGHLKRLKGQRVLISGGLGPTLDDITKPTLAEFFNEKLEFHAEADKLARAHYARRQREYNPEYMHYHMLPLSFRALSNPVGNAPGIYFKNDDYEIFAMPGVPAELQTMFSEVIVPNYFTQTTFNKNVIVKTYRIPESKIFNELEPEVWNKLEKYGVVSSLPHSGGVDIGVKLKKDSQAEIDEAEKEIIDLITNSKLKENIWHIGPELLEEVVVMKAKEKGLTIGFSESCTGGLLASRITDVAGSSSVFFGSVISYANEVKIKSLNVMQDTLKNHGAVSEQTAFEMAKGAREHLEVDIAVSTTGIAGPGGATPGKPVGTVGIGVSTKKGTTSRIYNFKGTRKSLKQSFSQAALFRMLEAINEA